MRNESGAYIGWIPYIRERERERERKNERINEEENICHTDVITAPMKQFRDESGP